MKFQFGMFTTNNFGLAIARMIINTLTSTLLFKPKFVYILGWKFELHTTFSPCALLIKLDSEAGFGIIGLVLASSSHKAIVPFILQNSMEH